MPELKKIPVILDGDPGHDDAIAWVLARASRQLDILAVTSCCGNQTIEKTTYNALRICTLIGLDAPVGKAACNLRRKYGEHGSAGSAVEQKPSRNVGGGQYFVEADVEACTAQAGQEKLVGTGGIVCKKQYPLAVGPESVRKLDCPWSRFVAEAHGAVNVKYKQFFISYYSYIFISKHIKPR